MNKTEFLLGDQMAGCSKSGMLTQVGILASFFPWKRKNLKIMPGALCRITPSKWIIPENKHPLALPGVGDYFGNNHAPGALSFG
jgi:hypothetical protein